MPESPSWEGRFRARTVASLTIPTAVRDRAVVGFTVDGLPQLHLWDGEAGSLQRLTSRPSGFPWGSPIAVSPRGDWLAYFEDDGGTEVGRWMRLPTAGTVNPTPIAPELAPIGTSALVIDRTGSTVAFSANDAAGTTIWFVRQADGTRRTWQVPAAQFAGPACFVGSGALAIGEWADDGRTALSVVDPESGVELGRLGDPGTSYSSWCSSPVPGDDRLLASSDRSGYRRPMLWNPRTGEREDLDLGSLAGDVRPVDWSPNGRLVLVWQMRGAVGTLYVHDLEARTTRPLDVPGGTLGAMPYEFAMGFISDTEVLARWESGDQPPTLLRIPVGGAPTLALPGEPVPAGRPWRPVTFPSADGTTIQGWLAVPDGNGPFPAVVDIHGGPTWVQGDVFAPLLQAFCDEGFAVLSVNYRGSTTFGRDFQESINGNAGQLEIQDVAAGRDWLVEQGIARSDAVVVEGLSYGGYLTLLAIGAYPERWAGGIAFVAIGDSVAGWEDSIEGVRSLDRMTFGGSPEEAPEKWRIGSPITYARDIRAPILVFNGRNDGRCPPRQMERYEARLKELGKEIDVEWFDAGHLGADEDVAIDQARRSLAFAVEVTQQRRPD
jgi:dienelactone hydrolase